MKYCKICKRMIRVRVMNRSINEDYQGQQGGVGEIIKNVTYSFYNHRNGNKLCTSSHKKFIEEYHK